MTVFAGRLGEFWGGFNANPPTGNMTPADATLDPQDAAYTGVDLVVLHLQRRSTHPVLLTMSTALTSP